MLRRLLPILFAVLFPSAVQADGLSPQEAVAKMKLPPGFSVRVVAAEPMIRQPVSISFDDRGRMWVLQYLQYPNYAGLKPVKQDQYLRTIWDRVPEPPPHGPRGLDRLTICYEPDENGVYRKSKDFATGLNIASGFCLGNGGVYVVQPPYLLFYADKNSDDVPDGDPEVLLTGFGMNDTHSLANSLQWGPDGWLYGAAGSTSTCEIKNPANPKEIVAFQQGIWRYHPKSKRFELFSEGGGNTYGLDFDKHGQVIAGTNWGGFAMLHQMQGAYYLKGFSKHGPLHNPHTYGYFDHVPYKGFQGGHVTCGGIVYQADAYPPQYRDQYIAANLLSNCVNWHKLEPAKSSFVASHGGTLIQGNDPWFRPIDCLQGPDGSVYVVDFYDRRAAHLDPVDNWDKTNGRVYKLEYQGTAKVPAFDLRKKTSLELVELLKHPNKWWRNEARRLLAERQDKSIHPQLRKWIKEEKGDLALEALWTLFQTGGWNDLELHRIAFLHGNEYVRDWSVRFYGEDQAIAESATILASLAHFETSPAVLAQQACTARRLPIETAQGVVKELLANSVSGTDPQIPLLIWWTIEAHLTRTQGTGTGWIPIPLSGNPTPLQLLTYERYARRLMAGDFPTGPQTVSRILADRPEAVRAAVLRGIAKALDGRTLDAIPEPLPKSLKAYRLARPNDPLIFEVLVRMNAKAEREELRRRVAAEKTPTADRIKAIDLLRQVRDPEGKALFLARFAGEKADAVRVALLAGLEAFDDPAIGETLLKGYSGFSPAVKKRALQALLTRPSWALRLVQQFDKGTFPKNDFTIAQAKTAVKLNDKAVTAIVEKHFGKLAPATPGEKLARIAWLNTQLGREKPGDPARGRALFTKHCAACHQLHGEGGKIGPDLTTADRKNRGYLLANIVDPSGYIRPEFVSQNVLTIDGRKLSGLASESGGNITLTNVVNDKPETQTVAKGDIESITPSAVSLMPEKLLDTLSYQEIADLFVYLGSDVKAKAPVANAPGSPAPRKLKVLLISGSFEYKSDDSLAAFQKHLEANYPVECTRAFAKSDKDKSLAGLENLETCDVAVFFTRRLQIDGDSLNRIKKYVAAKKPIVGIRTASHGFQNWLDMDKLVLGGDYKGHFGQNIPCEVTIDPKAKGNPVLAGVQPFTTRGGLYKNANVAADVTVLLRGKIPEGSEPVAWLRNKDGRRVFYTSLGTPDDFKEPNFIRLVVNGLAWTSQRELKK